MYTLTMPIGAVYPTYYIDDLLKLSVKPLYKNLDGTVAEYQPRDIMYAQDMLEKYRSSEFIRGSISPQTMRMMRLVGYHNGEMDSVWVDKERFFGLRGWFSVEDYKLLLDYYINKEK